MLWSRSGEAGRRTDTSSSLHVNDARGQHIHSHAHTQIYGCVVYFWLSSFIKSMRGRRTLVRRMGLGTEAKIFIFIIIAISISNAISLVSCLSYGKVLDEMLAWTSFTLYWQPLSWLARWMGQKLWSPYCLLPLSLLPISVLSGFRRKSYHRRTVC